MPVLFVFCTIFLALILWCIALEVRLLAAGLPIVRPTVSVLIVTLIVYDTIITV
jgi:hypothetical protein